MTPRINIFNRPGRRGVAATLAMMFLTLFATLTLAMYSMSSLSVQTADNYNEVDRARGAAESGLRWIQYRFLKMARPKSTVGSITHSVALALGPSIRTAISNDMATLLSSTERPVTISGSSLTTSKIALDNEAGRFQVTITQDSLDATILHVVSTGTYGKSKRSVSMDFKIDKKVKFAVVAKVPIQIGRNTIIEGPVAMTTATKFPPLYMLSDFRSLTANLTSRIDSFNDFLEAHHIGHDNRVNMDDATEATLAMGAGYLDSNDDGFIDEYDLFLHEFDHNEDKVITKSEFTNPLTNKLYDADLFDAIDGLGASLNGEPTRVGYKDEQIDNRDGYAKVRGQIVVGATAAAWDANLAPSGQVIQDQIKGPIAPSDPLDSPVKFGVTANEIFDLDPANFDATPFRNQSGTAAGSSTTTVNVLVKNATLSAAHTTLGTADEKSPYGSTSYQATYRRPVFRNMTFENVRIPKGMNALFDNCTFKGVTFIDLQTNITNTSGQTTTSASQAMTWSQRMKSGLTFNKNTALTFANSHGFEQGNNLRFNDCKIEGPIASDVPTAYSHFTNSWEFTGATSFDNKWVDSSGKATATIVAPQTNIEMGSFTDPSQAPSTLTGVVVAGNLDVRGTSTVDGSIIITGDGAGNSTQGWFGPSDAATEPNSPMPEGGYGRLSIRYNPHRAMPDGINMAVDILPDIDTYREGQ